MRCRFFSDLSHFSLCLCVFVLEAPSQLLHTFSAISAQLGPRTVPVGLSPLNADGFDSRQRRIGNKLRRRHASRAGGLMSVTGDTTPFVVQRRVGAG